MLDRNYIVPQFASPRDRDFIHVVIKLQIGKQNEMNDDEKAACKELKRNEAEIEAVNDNDTNDTIEGILRGRKGKHSSASTEGFVNPGFVLRSVAECERLCAFKPNQQSKTPLMPESFFEGE